MTATTQDQLVGGRDRTNAPGWPEVLAGGIAYLASYLLVMVLLPLVEDESVAGVVGLLVSGAMGLTAFAVAVLVRRRGLAAFGVRRASARHLAAGAALGIAAYGLGAVASVAFIVLSGDQQNVQTTYQAAAAAGGFSLILTLLAGSVITPLGEEALFRGVLANALLARHRAWIAVILSAAVFALAHGINPVLPAAFVVGVLTALLFRRSGSIWPGVVLHGINNAAAFLVPVVIAAVGT